MSGIKYLLDTNIIIGFYQHNPAISARETQAIETLLARMTYLAITPDIENKTIEIRRNQQLKLPDSIIAATAQHHQLELLTLDKKLADMR